MQSGIDIIVTNYKTAWDLDVFLSSLDLYRPTVPFSVTVCNPCAEQADIDVADRWAGKFDDFTHLRWDQNVGYARCNNSAAALGRKSVIAIFNADCQFTSNSLQGCYEALDCHPSWGVLGPQQVDHRGLMTHAGIFGTPDAPQHRGWHQPPNPEFNDVRQAVAVSGAALFIKRHVWRELTECPIFKQSCPEAEGAFLVTPHYYEETYCVYHARAHNYETIYFGQASLIHKWHQASPVGGWAEQQFPLSQRIFRKACDDHSILHD